MPKLWLFGSFARGNTGRRSDVDVLVSVPSVQKLSLLDVAGVRLDTDLVIREEVLPRFGETVRDDFLEVF